MAHLSSLRQNISYTPIFWSAHGHTTGTRWPVCALSANLSRANATSSPLRSCSRGCIPASLWKSGNAALGRSAHAGSSRPSPPLWILTLSLCMGPGGPPPFWVFLVSPVPLSFVLLACVGSEVRACVRLQPFRVPGHLGTRSRALCSGPPGGASGGRGAAFRRGSILLSQRGPTGLAVKSCPTAPPDRSASSHRCSGSSASAVGFVEPASAANAPRAPTPSLPRAVAVDPSATAARRAAEARRRNRDKHRRRTRATSSDRCGVKTSIKPPLASSSGDDVHNTSNSILLWCADTIAQQDGPVAEPSTA